MSGFELGAALAAFSGLFALGLKKWAMRRAMPAAFTIVGAIFALRMLLALGGTAWSLHQGLAVGQFVTGFFGVYLLLQWLEIAFVLSESKRLSAGG